MDVRVRVDSLRQNSSVRGKSISELFPADFFNIFRYENISQGVCLKCGMPMTRDEMEPADKITPRAMHAHCFSEITNTETDECFVCGGYLSNEKVNDQQYNQRDIHNRICGGRCMDYFSIVSCKVLGDDMSFLANEQGSSSFNLPPFPDYKQSQNQQFQNPSQPNYNQPINQPTYQKDPYESQYLDEADLQRPFQQPQNQQSQPKQQQCYYDPVKQQQFEAEYRAKLDKEEDYYLSFMSPGEDREQALEVVMHNNAITRRNYPTVIESDIKMHEEGFSLDFTKIANMISKLKVMEEKYPSGDSSLREKILSWTGQQYPNQNNPNNFNPNQNNPFPNNPNPNGPRPNKPSPPNSGGTYNGKDVVFVPKKRR